VLSGKAKRVKKNVYIWYQGKTWARSVDYGVLLTNKTKKYQYQKFSGHFDITKLNAKSFTETEQLEFVRLKEVIDDRLEVNTLPE
jgi:hypothetical protein